MIIDERIFNELEEIDLETEEGQDLLYDFAQINLDKEMEKAPEDWDEDDAEDYIETYLEDTISFYKIPKNSLLEDAIFTYGDAKGYDNLFDTFDKLGLTVINNEAYFTAGCGYNIIDVDLLDGDGSGNTKRIFLKIINENN